MPLLSFRRLPIHGSIFEGSVSEFLNQPNFAGITKVKISPDKIIVGKTDQAQKDEITTKEMEGIIQVLRQNSLIKYLSFSTAPLGNEQLDFLADELKNLSFLNHLSVDGTNLSSRVESEKAGLHQLVQKMGETHTLRSLALTSTLVSPKNNPAICHPLNDKTVSIITKASIENVNLLSFNLQPFWVKNEDRIGLIQGLVGLRRPCPTLTFDNFEIKPDNIEKLATSFQENDLRSAIHTEVRKASVLHKS